MVNLILVRHGFSEANKINSFAGQTDVPLCDLGFKQAELVSNYIIEKYKPDAIYSSPMSRSIDTVKKIAEILSIPLIIEQDLIEIHGGDWEGMKWADMEKLYPDYYAAWSERKGVLRCPNGESMEDAGKRALKALRKICLENDGKTLVIASHGGVIRTLQCILSNIPLEKFNEVPWTPNACISIIEYDNGEFIPKVFGITEHLKDLLTNLPNI